MTYANGWCNCQSTSPDTQKGPWHPYGDKTCEQAVKDYAASHNNEGVTNPLIEPRTGYAIPSEGSRRCMIYRQNGV